MNRAMRFLGTILIVHCAWMLAISICLGQTARPGGPEEVRPTPPPVRPPYATRPVPRPRPIEGGTYYYELAEVHKRYGAYDKAIEMLQTAIEKETDAPKKSRYYESLSEVYQAKGDTKGAAEQITKVLATAQTVEEKCRYNGILGQIYEQAGDTEGAKKAYEFVATNAKDDTQKRGAQLNLFRIYQKSGELDKVIVDLEKKLEANPGDEESLSTLAQIFNSVVREPARALPVYERLSKLNPKDMTILNRLVYLYQSNKQYEKAAETYQRIIEATPSPNKSYYYQHVSRMYMMAGKKDEAINWAEKSLSEEKAAPYTYVSVAQIYLQNNLADKAVELYDRALALCQRPIEKHQVALRFADLFAQNNKEDKAEEIYKGVLKEAVETPIKSQARSKLIALYRKQGKTSEIEALTAEEGKAPAPKK